MQKLFECTLLMALSFFQYTANVTDKFSNVEVNFSSIIILEEEAKIGLRDFTDTGIDKINFAAYFNEVSLYSLYAEM